MGIDLQIALGIQCFLWAVLLEQGYRSTTQALAFLDSHLEQIL